MGKSQMLLCEQEGEGMCRTMDSHPQSSLINSTCEALAHIRYLSSVRTHPGGEVGFGFKILPKVLVTLEVAKVGLQGKRGQEEVGLLSLNALREQHLFPQMPVVVVPGCPVTAGQTDSTINQISGHMVSRADCTGISCRLRLHLPDQSPVLNIILGSEVNDHRRPKLVDALEKKSKWKILLFFSFF